MIVCSVIMAMLLSVTTACARQFVDPNYHNEGTGGAGIAAMFLFGFTFNSSFGPSQYSSHRDVSSTDVVVQSLGFTRSKSSP